MRKVNGENKMSNLVSKGWMIMGVCLHLTGDIFAHRARITKNMAFSGNTIESTYETMVLAASASESRILGDHIADKQGLYDKLDDGPIPAIRLKDYLFTGERNIVINGTVFEVNDAQAYEDNTFFYGLRYDATIEATESTLMDMWDDTGNNTSYTFYYDNINVPLVDWSIN